MYGSSIGGPWTEEDVDLHITNPLIPALWPTIDSHNQQKDLSVSYTCLQH